METLLEQAKESLKPTKKHLKLNETEVYYFDKGIESAYNKLNKLNDSKYSWIHFQIEILRDFIKAVESNKTYYPKFENFKRCETIFRAGHAMGGQFYLIHSEVLKSL